jgi:hypothetical protein
MKTPLKKLLKILTPLTAAVLLLFVSSCNNWLFNEDNTKATWGTIITSFEFPEATFPYYIISDDSLLLCPVNHASIADFNPIDGQRVIVYYKPYGSDTTETNEIQYRKDITVVQVNLVPTQDMVYSSQKDTLGTDRVEPQFIWLGGGGLGSKRHLNIQYTIYASNTDKHKFNLVRDQNLESPMDSEGYYVVEFCHDAKEDPEYANYTNVISFPLEGECIEAGVKGLKIKVKTITQGNKEYILNY